MHVTNLFERLRVDGISSEGNNRLHLFHDGSGLLGRIGFINRNAYRADGRACEIDHTPLVTGGRVNDHHASALTPRPIRPFATARTRASICLPSHHAIAESSSSCHCAIRSSGFFCARRDSNAYTVSSSWCCRPALVQILSTWFSIVVPVCLRHAENLGIDCEHRRQGLLQIPTVSCINAITRNQPRRTSTWSL